MVPSLMDNAEQSFKYSKLLADVICLVITLVGGLLGNLIPVVQTVVPAILNITGLSPLVNALNL